MADRSAKIVVRNETGSTFKFQVLHQYTGKDTEQSAWNEIHSGQEMEVLTVHYRTGIFTTGVDNWIINGIERRFVTAGIILPPGLPPINIGGNVYVDLKWFSGHGFGSDWKVHTLTSDDDGKITKIIVRPTIVEFISNSGNSSTYWKPEYDIVPRI